MRKIVVLSMVSLDGVMQSPSGPDEDPSGNFKFGGWTVPYADKAVFDAIIKELSTPFDLLLGRKTYDIFAGYWPKQKGAIADPFNKAKKYVASDGDIDLTWKESILLSGDVAAKLKALKKESGPMLQVHGSGNLVQTLLKHDLVDELRLRIFPVTIGSGQRLFADGTIPASFSLIDVHAGKTGVLLANYKRSGDFSTGTME